MESRLYLHIGPPKTASTTLQSAIQNVQLRSVVYGGVYQPRKKNTGSLAQRLQLYTDGRRPLNHPSVVSAVDEIKTKIASKISVFISEEMFLVSESNCTFPEKLRKLRAAFQDTPTTILFTVRDPLDAIPSLYQELFPKLPLAQQLSFRRFCSSEAAMCLDYQRVLSELTEAGFNEYRALDFNFLVRGKLPVSAIFGDHFPDDTIVPLKAMNVGSKVGNGRALPRVSLKNAAYRQPLEALSSILRIRDRTITDTLPGILDRVTLRREGVRNLVIPQEIATQLEESYRKALRLCTH